MFSKKTYRETRWIEKIIDSLCLSMSNDSMPYVEKSNLVYDASFRDVKPQYHVEVRKHPWPSDPIMLHVTYLRQCGCILQCFVPPQDDGSYPNGAIIELNSLDESKERLVVGENE